MNIRPLGDRVLLQPLKAEEKSAGGIIIPDSVSKDKPIQGTVIAVGEGKKADDGSRIALDVKVDDVVFFSKYAGTDLKIDGESYLIIQESEILAVNG
jgi:chaperonin GroES